MMRPRKSSHLRWTASAGTAGRISVANGPSYTVMAAGTVAHPGSRFPYLKAQRTSILVVEDDIEIRAALVSLLESEGFAAEEAADGEEALRVLDTAKMRTGLILLDLMMPKMNGWEFRDVMLTDADLRAIPVVVLSALGTSFAERELMDLAAVLPKPVSAEVLLEAIERCFRRFH